MKTTALIVVCIFCVFGCATSTKFNVDEKSGSTLINYRERVGDSSISKFFEAYNGIPLYAGDWTPGINGEFVVPSGQSNLVLRIVYGPNYYEKVLEKPLYEGSVFVSASLKPGQTYRIQSVIAKGKATLSVTDSNGAIVSEKLSVGLLPIRRNISIPIIIPGS